MKVDLHAKGKQVKLIIPKKYIAGNESYLVTLDSDEVKELYERLKGLTDKPIQHDDKPYWDDISTYVNEIERDLEVSGNKGALRLRLICYTDQEDDNWIGLSQKRIAKLAGMIYPYI